MNLIELFKRMWAENPSTAALASSFLLGSITGILMMFKQYIIRITKYISSLYVTSFTVSSDNMYYYILMKYLSDFNCMKKFRNFKILSNEEFGQRGIRFIDNDRVSFSLDNGVMFVFINNRFFKVNINTRKLENSFITLVDLTLKTYGRSYKPYEDLMRKALIYYNDERNKEEYIDIAENSFNVIKERQNLMEYNNIYGDYKTSIYKTKSFDNIFLEEETKNNLIDRISRFLSSRKYYDEHQIPYHFGLLMYGKPGTGKSSIIKALINHFDFRNIYYLNSDEIQKIGKYNYQSNVLNYQTVINKYIDRIVNSLYGDKNLGDWTLQSIDKFNSFLDSNNYRLVYSKTPFLPSSFFVKKETCDKLAKKEKEFGKFYNEEYAKVHYQNNTNEKISLIIIEDIDTDLIKRRNDDSRNTDFESYLNYMKTLGTDELACDPLVELVILKHEEMIKNKFKINLDFKSNKYEWFENLQIYMSNFFNSLDFSNEPQLIKDRNVIINYLSIQPEELKKVFDEEYIPSLKDSDTKSSNKNNNNTGTLSFILNSLDGLLSSEDYMILATTNHVDSIDPAILRPGRFDYKIEIGCVNKEIYRQFCSKFYPDQTIEDNIDIKPNVTIAFMQEAALSGLTYEEFENEFTVKR